MDTDELISALAFQAKPVCGKAAVLRLAGAIAAGAVASLLLIALFIGDPFFGVNEVEVMAFGVKMAFAVSLLLLAGTLLYHAGCPGRPFSIAVQWIAAPFIILAVLAGISLGQADAGGRASLIFGSSWKTCLVTVTLLAAPAYALLAWAFRRMAPTDLKLAGLLAGITAGSTGALIYALHCPETSPAFLLLWYGLAITFAAIAGRLVGPLALRW